MCRHERRSVGLVPAFRLICVSPKLTSFQGLVLVGIVTLSLNFGCTSSGSGRRFFAAKALRSANSSVQASRSATIAGDRISDNKSKAAASEIRQVGDQSEQMAVDANTAVPDATPPTSNFTPESKQVELPASGVTLADLQIIAVQNNPTLSQARAAISAEQGVYRQAGLYPNPQIGYLNGAASAPGVKQSNGMFFSQEFVTAHKLALAQQAASAEIKRYEWDHESQRLRILNDLKIRYYEVLGAQRAREVTQGMVETAEKSLKMAQQNFEAKHVTRTDLLQAKVHLETVRLSYEDAEHRHRAAWGQLATIIGISPMQPAKLVGDLSEDIPQFDLEACQQYLLANSPQIRSTECDLGHAWAQYREARAQAVPNVTLQTVAEYDRALQSSTLSTLVAMPLPVFNRNQGNIDQSSADIVAAQAEVCRVQLVLRDQLADSFRRYQTSYGQAQRLEKVILPSAKENLQLTEQVYASGETAFTTVLFAQQTYFQNQMAYVEALTELHKVATEIQGMQLTGGLNPAAIGGAIQNQPGGGAARQRQLLNEVQDRNSKQLFPAAQIGQ